MLLGSASAQVLCELSFSVSLRHLKTGGAGLEFGVHGWPSHILLMWSFGPASPQYTCRVMCMRSWWWECLCGWNRQDEICLCERLRGVERRESPSSHVGLRLRLLLTGFPTPPASPPSLTSSESLVEARMKPWLHFQSLRPSHIFLLPSMFNLSWKWQGWFPYRESVVHFVTLKPLKKYIYIYIYTCIYRHTCIYIYMHIFIHTYIKQTHRRVYLP